MQEIKKIGVMSVAKISLIFGIILGLLMGIYFSFAIPALANSGALGETQAITYDSKFYLSTLVLVPIVYALVAFLSGIVSAALYNLFARWVGGIKVEFKSK